MYLHRQITPISCLLLALPVFAGAQAQGRRTPEIVLMSSSGGIAKGAYQGGMDWTIAEFLRRQRDSSFRRKVGLPLGPPRFTLGAATGASAGNVNALFNALTWCTDRIADSGGANSRKELKPEESLHWQTWVNTGFSQMLPEKDRPGREPAVLDRRFFEEVHLEVVLDYLGRMTPIECDVPLGITMTKLTPERVPLFSNDVNVNVQRFATILNVRTISDQGPAFIDFQSVDPSVRRGSLGVLALLPTLGSHARATRDRRLGDLFDAVLASSSFPVAFSPKVVCYVAGGLALAGPGKPPCHAFSDGGLFDNNPFGLAVGLFELDYRAHALPMPVPDVGVAYSNPNLYRGKLDKARAPSGGSEPDATGIGAVIQLLRGAIPAAREYELQSLLRQAQRDSVLRLAGDPLVGAARPRLMLSSRSAPILGEQLGSFGAFLGRPFREYDFYTGIYDGLEFVARHFLCGSVPLDQAQTCTDREFASLLTSKVMGLDGLALEVVGWQSLAESAVMPIPTVPVPDAAPVGPVDAWRHTILAAVHNALLPLRVGPFSQPCTRRNDPIGGWTCGTRMDEVLDALSRDTNVVHAAQWLRDWCNDPAHANERRLGRCSSDDAFVELVEQPRQHLHGIVQRALNNLDDAENAIRDRGKGEREYSAFTELAYAQYRASSFRYRRGIRRSRIEINPSSAVWDARSFSRFAGSLLVGTLAPNYLTLLGFGQLSGDADAHYSRRVRATSITWGWRPIVVRPHEMFYLSVPLEVSRFGQTSDPDHRRSSVTSGITVGTHVWTLPWFSSLDAGVLFGEHVVNQEPDRERGYRPIASVSGRLFTEKLQVTARWAPSRGWSAGFGLADLNGLLYWWVR